MQDQDDFKPAAGEDSTAGPTGRGRACARVYKPGDRAGSAGASSRHATSKAQRKRRLQSGELKEHMRQAKMDELEQTVATKELHSVQRRYHQ